MPTATTTALDLDEQLLGPLLVAEVEAYLRTLATTPAPAPAAACPARPAPGSAWYRLALAVAAEPTRPTPDRTDTAAPAGPWWDGYPAPASTLLDRVLGRRPIVPVTPAQHLQLMDAYIREHGWTQGRLWDAEGRVCVLGAHLRVLAAGYGTPAVAWQARLQIGNTLGWQGTPVPVDTWNDRPTTRQADVHQLLARASALT
ncbi:hypothetical protein [Kitasatospora sp. A2-31]|uniref:DUF6197 family protein n=1 Tax=Kitasatospora sp. A2-31 TaxID=2916414 RepID=UPI001EEA2997|nr:hypothetical protein [Kitasatospora sp. A2-31]MCG6497631.1 hypothetical protein [Kitasatospora sp. A2-31]